MTISAETSSKAERESSAGPIPPAELVTDGLHRLGGYVELNGGVSWAPPIPGRWQPLSCYVVAEHDRNYLIDTGAAGHRAIIADQIARLLPRGLPLTGFLTRTEYQCAGNLGAIFHARGLDELVSGGRNPFQASEDAAHELRASVRRRVLEVGRKKAEPLGDSLNLVVIPAVIRILSTNWVYDHQRKILFTSDWFGHTSVADPANGAIIDSLARDETTHASAQEHILSRYQWLPQATTQPLQDWLRGIFDQYEVEIIAPTFGCVLKGKDVVGKHYEIAMDVLRRIGR